eukprot:967450-Pyramimonas_sp.AAC.1
MGMRDVPGSIAPGWADVDARSARNYHPNPMVVNSRLVLTKLAEPIRTAPRWLVSMASRDERLID